MARPQGPQPVARFLGSLAALVLFTIVPALSPLDAQSEDEEQTRFSQMDLLDDVRPLRPGDRIRYRVLEEREPYRLLVVARDGNLAVPLAGMVEAAGTTLQELGFRIKEILEEVYFYQATVHLELDAAATLTAEILVYGQVRRPGPVVFDSSEEITVANAILSVGGLTESADPRRVTVERTNPNTGSTERLTVDVDAVLTRGEHDRDIVVEDGDLVIVPQLSNREREQYYIFGRGIAQPGMYPLPVSGNLTVSEAILAAGNFTEFARRKQVRLLRADSELPEDEREIVVNVQDFLERGEGVDPVIFPDDRIEVRERAFSIGFN